MTAAVHVVAVNYFGATALDGYLRSLLAQDCTNWRMTVVDNSDDTHELTKLHEVTRDHPRVSVRAAPGNLGYFGGARWLLDQTPETAIWTVVSNVDVRLADPTFLTRLLTLDGRTPVVAPSVVGVPAGREQNPHLTTRPTVRQMRRLRTKLAHPLTAQASLLADRVRTRVRPRRSPGTSDRASHARLIYAPHGSFIALHQRYFTAGGSLRHRPFLFGEEITVAEHCHRLGLPVLFEPALRVTHVEHQATGLLRSWRVLRAQVEAARYCHDIIAAADRTGAAKGPDMDWTRDETTAP
ncbi:glycosyltransferase [Plantactinospora sp. B24E8]|uniref:glycosyltransferase family 2 protein n=1 Tax=Plantactinospora sp. B24E8 TaxID=3153567 RepID=UPI00325ED733